MKELEDINRMLNEMSFLIPDGHPTLCGKLVDLYKSFRILCDKLKDYK